MDARHHPDDLTNLPTKLGEVWQVHAKRVPSGLIDFGSRRPWLVLIVSTTTDSLRSEDLIISYEFVDDFPTPSVLWERIQHTILAPKTRRPSRPSIIEFRSREYCNALRPKMASAFIRARTNHRFDCWNDVYAGILAKPAIDMIPSPLTAPGTSLEALGRFVSAAAAFYEQLPRMRTQAQIAVTREGHPDTCWRGMIGDHDKCKLRLVETSIADQRSSSTLRESWRQFVSLSVSFGCRHQLPPCYRRAIESNHWKIAGADAYPITVRTNPGGTVRAPLGWELDLLRQVLGILPDMLALQRQEEDGSDQAHPPWRPLSESDIPRWIVKLDDATDELRG